MCARLSLKKKISGVEKRVISVRSVIHSIRFSYSVCARQLPDLNVH